MRTLSGLALVFVAGCGPRVGLPEVTGLQDTTDGVPGAPAQARAAYLQALWHEARGEWQAATEALARAQAFDPDSDTLRRAAVRLQDALQASPGPHAARLSGPAQ